LHTQYITEVRKSSDDKEIRTEQNIMLVFVGDTICRVFYIAWLTGINYA